MSDPFVPDLSSRPFAMTVERQMKAAAELLYDAWTSSFDKWFAQPGELIMTPKEGSLFFGILSTRPELSTPSTF